MEIANRHNVSPAQVIIRWEIQEGLLTIPGAINPDYIQENIAAAQGMVNGISFFLTETDMEQMRNLNKEKRFFNATYKDRMNYLKMNIED